MKKKVTACILTAMMLGNITAKAQWVQGTGQIYTANNVVIGSAEAGVGQLTVRTNAQLESGLSINYSTIFTRIFSGSLTAGAWGSTANLYDGGIIFGSTSGLNNPVTGFVIAPWGNQYRGLRVNPNGTVSIGEVNDKIPAGYNLFVNNGILTEKVKVAVLGSTSWADYVFHKDYKLMPLAEVEQFVKANNHLPNVPSASEMVKEGNDLGKTTAKLLEKIEELTLYIISQQKEIELLKIKVNGSNANKNNTN